MSRNVILIAVALTFFQAACKPSNDTVLPEITSNLPEEATNPGYPSVKLGMNSNSDEIQQAMLTSALNWTTVWMDGTVTHFFEDQPPLTLHEQVWIDQATPKFRILVSGADINNTETIKTCDGTNVVETNLITGQSQTSTYPDSARVGQFVPTLQPGSATGNPIWGQMGTRISQMAFPSDFAQNEGVFKPVGMDNVAGRETLIMEWTFSQNSLPSWKLWLDTQTAVILKAQFYQKTGGEPVQNERVVNHVVFDQIFDEALFIRPTLRPEFASDPNPQVSLSPTTPIPAQNIPMGELYFFTLPHQAGQAPQLVSLPGHCVVGLDPCPQLKTIPAPFPFNFNLSALAWSPDGKLAAFAYPDNPNGMPTKLFLFDPSAGTWTSLAEFPYIDPPFWSPDGTWIAFRVQDGKGGEDVYVIHRDGSELKNLTASGSLPGTGRPYVMDGWLTENILVRPAIPGTHGGVFLLRAEDGSVRPMFETMLTKSVFVISPDGAWLAYDDYDYTSQKHILKVIEPDSANPVDLTNFVGGSLYPIIWSTDAQRLAFVHSSTDAAFNPVAEVYVTGRDGLGLKQVYKGVTVGSLVFAPDGTSLLVEETSTPTGGHLYAVNTNTLEQHILSAPGLILEANWYAPSWRR
jgi:hypothetical protein